MITTTSSGQAVTLSAWKQYVRQVDSKIYRQVGSTWVELGNDIQNWSISKGICDDGRFEFGTVFIPSATLTVNGTIPLDTKYIRIDVGVKVGNEYEYVTLGRFWVQEREVDYYTTTLALSSALLGANSGKEMSSALGKTNVVEILSAIANDMGVGSISLETPISATDELRTALTSGTCREGLEQIAKCYGLYFTETPTEIVGRRIFGGNSTIVEYAEELLQEPFVSKGACSLNTGRIIVQSGYSDPEESIEAIELSWSKENGTIRKNVVLESYDVSMSNEYESDAVFDALCNNIKNTSCVWEAGNIAMQMGNPLIEPMDVVNLKDGGTTTHSIRAFNIRLDYDGALISSVSAPINERSDSGLGYEKNPNPVALLLPIINTKVDDIATDVSITNERLSEVSEKYESLLTDEQRLEQRVNGYESALKYKMDTNLVQGGIVKGNIEWSDSDNSLHIKGENEEGNCYETVIGGDGIKFLYGSATNRDVVASVNQDKLIINKTVVYTDSVIGNWIWQAEASGNLCLKYGGAE